MQVACQKEQKLPQSISKVDTDAVTAIVQERTHFCKQVYTSTTYASLRGQRPCGEFLPIDEFLDTLYSADIPQWCGIKLLFFDGRKKVEAQALKTVRIGPMNGSRGKVFVDVSLIGNPLRGIPDDAAIITLYAKPFYIGPAPRKTRITPDKVIRICRENRFFLLTELHPSFVDTVVSWEYTVLEEAPPSGMSIFHVKIRVGEPHILEVAFFGNQPPPKIGVVKKP